MKMKKITAWITGMVVFIAVAVFGTAAPANAASATFCDNLGTASGVRTCAAVTWVTSTMTVTSITLTTPQYCSNLESSGGRYEYFGGQTAYHSYNHWGVGCTDSFGIYDDYPDSTQSIVVTAWAKARVNLAPDWLIDWRFTLNKNGSASGYAQAYPRDNCC